MSMEVADIRYGEKYDTDLFGNFEMNDPSYVSAYESYVGLSINEIFDTYFIACWENIDCGLTILMSEDGSVFVYSGFFYDDHTICHLLFNKNGKIIEKVFK